MRNAAHAAQVVGTNDCNGNHDNRHRRAFQSDGDAGDDVGGRSGLGCFGDRLHGTIFVLRIVLSDIDKGDTQDDTGDACNAKPEPAWDTIVSGYLATVQEEVTSCHDPNG